MSNTTQTVKLLVSDVDGTLLDPHKELTERARQSVLRIKEAGVLFSIISARPPRAVQFLIDSLQITEPIACFNGALICKPNYEIINQTLLEKSDASKVATIILEQGLDLWMFRGAEWFVSKLNGPHVDGHIKYLNRLPRYLGQDYTMCSVANKLVGVSNDFAAVKRCEAAVLECCGDRISATRSADYYLDVTHRDANKGCAVEQLSKLMNIPLENIATIGDMPTDVLMFVKTGISIAMGNADDEVKSKATFTTSSNAEDGFAAAMENIILPRVAKAAGAQP